MKILLVNDFGYKVGGAEEYFFGLEKGLKQRGHQIFTVSSNHVTKKNGIITDFSVERSGNFFNTDSYFNKKSYLQFKNILNNIKPDIVHLNNIFYLISPSILFAVKKYTTVMTLHDYYIICMSDKTLPDGSVCAYSLGSVCCKKGCVNRRIYIEGRVKRYVIERGLKNVNLFISPSKYLQIEFEKNGIKNIQTLPNFYDFSGVTSPSFAHSSVLLYIGRLAKQKGVDYLIKAMPDVIKKFPKAILKIAGTGPEEDNLKKLVGSLGIEKNVKFLGWVDGKMKDAVLRECYVVVLPSVWPENDPVIKYETAFYGKALLASNIGGIPEFVKDGEIGFLVPPKDSAALSDKIIYALSNPVVIEMIGKNLVKKCSAYTLDKYIENLEALYREVLSQPTA
jgi:glycosyltransferase involved in cell wall biosynthesis